MIDLNQACRTVILCSNHNANQKPKSVNQHFRNKIYNRLTSKLEFKSWINFSLEFLEILDNTQTIWTIDNGL